MGDGSAGTHPAGAPRGLRAFIAHALCVLTALAFQTPLCVRAEAPADPQRKELAREHFERGVAHVDRGEWQAALVEFLRSRERLETLANTKNAAICLRKVGRYDESLALFERLLSGHVKPGSTEPTRA